MLKKNDMNINTKANIIKYKKLRLPFWQFVQHYFIVIFLMLIPVFSIVKIFVTPNTSVSESFEFTSLQFIGPMTCLLLAIAFIFIQKSKLKFIEIRAKCTAEEFQEAIRRTVDDLEWKVEYNKNGNFRANRPWNWTGSWGESITIIRDNDKLLFNSICDTTKFSFPFSAGWNRKNLRTFISHLNETINGIPMREKKESSDRKGEWTIKRILIRLIAYPFCLFLIILGVYGIINPVNFKTPLAGIGGIIIASIYFYTDIKMILAKKDKSTNV